MNARDATRTIMHYDIARKATVSREATPVTSSGRPVITDGRRIHAPVEIRQRVHTSHRRITTPHRMSMIILDGQRREQLGSVGMDALSYFPKIHENQTTRDFREQKAKQPVNATEASSTSRARRTSIVSSSLQSMRLDAMTPESAVGSLAPSLMAELDQDGVLAIREAFRRHRYMCEDDFIVEMLCGLHAESLPREAQVELTAQLSALFRQADLRSQGVLNWSDMCAFIAQSSGALLLVAPNDHADHQYCWMVDPDEVCTLDDTLINKYSVDMAPCPLNLVSEVKSMFYFAPVDQLLIQEAKHKGFRMYNAKTNRPVLEVNNPHSGPILDAIYSPFGRYIITSSTSPILCFYDADQLRLRQQIPTEGVQTALALPLETTLGSPILFSACASGQVYAWNMETLQLTDTFLSKGSHGHAAITDLVVIDGMSQIACASMDTKIHMIDLHKGSVAKTLSGHKKGISMLRYCNENGYLVSAGVDHSLQVWNPHLEQRVGTLSGHRHQLIGMEVIENSPEIITADESGIVKIWDLRKFSVVQTLVKEQYIRSSESSATGVARRNIARQMNAMCYMATQKRIAIAHSTVYFVDAEQPLQPTEQRHQEAIKPSFTGDEEDGENAVPTDAVKPLLITYNPPSRCIISFSGWDFKCWDIFTGKFIRSVPRSLVGEYTTVCEVEDHYSCFVGTDNGVIARLMIPSGSIVVQRIVHTAEVTTAQYMPARKQVVIGYADGIIVVADNETLEQIHRFHHWRGVQSALHAHSFPATNQEDDGGDGFSYSVPSHLRTFFYGNEIERLKHIFGEVDVSRSGAIPLSKLSEVLEKAFPTPFSSKTRDPATTSDDALAPSKGNMISFATLLEVLKQSLASESRAWPMASIACLDAHESLSLFVSASSTDGTFCSWNLKNGAVLAQGTSGLTPQTTQPILHVRFLHPYPYFVCVDDSGGGISLWSSVAIPPVFMHGHQCLLRFQHRLRPHVENGSQAFMTETTNDQSANKEDDSQPSVRCIDWYYGGEHLQKFICVGDDHGYVTIYDFKSLLRRIEDLKRECSFRKQRSIMTEIGLVVSDAPVRQQEPIFLAASMRILNQWRAHHNVAIRDVRQLAIDKNGSERKLLLVSAGEQGAICIWSVVGQLLGKLYETLPPPRLRTPWLVNLDSEQLKEKEKLDATTILDRVEEKLNAAIAVPPRKKSDRARRTPLLARLSNLSSSSTTSTTSPNTVKSPQEALLEWRQQQRQGNHAAATSRRSSV